MATEFEVISHGLTSYKIFFNNLLYRAPHVHKDYEICLVLSGKMQTNYRNASVFLSTDDLFIVNPFQSHEFIAQQPSLLLILQISSSFFSSYFPQVDNLEFIQDKLPSGDPRNRILRDLLLDIADLHFRQPQYYELKAIAQINLLFYHILFRFPHTIMPEKEKSRSQNKATQMRRIMNYIDANYSQKLLLSDIAREESLTLSYLSHFFRDAFGMPFQTYLLKMRCEKARKLLLCTDLSLLDICISCGFSDMKYFNRGFQEQYGHTPREYRMLFEEEQLPSQQEVLLTTQDILSRNASLAILSRYYPSEEAASS